MSSPTQIEDMLPSDLLEEPPVLPYEVHGFGQFCTYESLPYAEITIQDKSCLPVRQTPGSAGHDLVANKAAVVPAHGSVIVDTGIKIALPQGYYGRVAGRSSLAFKHDVTAFEGTIDEDYRGPLKVKLFNHSDVSYNVKKGDRVAQLIVSAYVAPRFGVACTLADTTRGEGGFGSSGR